MRQRQRQAFLKRQTERANMKDRLLAAYLAGLVDANRFRTKSTDLSGQMAEVERALDRCGDNDLSRGDIALAVFDWSQEAPAAQERSKIAQEHAILELPSSSRTLSPTALCLEKRKPSSHLAERPSVQSSRGDWTRLGLFVRGANEFPAGVVETLLASG